MKTLSQIITWAFALISCLSIVSVSYADAARMANVSVQGDITESSSVLTVHFTIEDGVKTLLIRGIGPGLERFGVENPVSDPLLSVRESKGGVGHPIIGSWVNNDWEDKLLQSSGISGEGVITYFNKHAGAFPLTAGSKDSAMIVNLEPGVYSATVSGMNGARGRALLEIYELKGVSKANEPPTVTRFVLPKTGIANTPVHFSVLGADPDYEDSLRYWFDMDGDGNPDVYTTHFAVKNKWVELQYTWRIPGVYRVMVVAEDSHGAFSLAAVETITITAQP